MIARGFSMTLGLASGLLLFAVCRKLTANTLASAAAVLIFLASPATAYSFATATPIAVVAVLHLFAVWLLVTSLGRPRVGISVVMGLVLATMVLHAADMFLPAVLLAILYIAALGRARWIHGPLVVAIAAIPIAGAIAVLPDQFVAFLLEQPLPRYIGELAGLVRPQPDGGDLWRAAREGVDTTLLPHGGTLLLGLLLIGFTWKGPRVLWVAPIYVVVVLIAFAVFPTPDCALCAAIAPSQVVAVGALSAAMALAFSGRLLRKNALSGTPFVMGGAILALAINTFAPGLATRDLYKFFPAEMLKQTRPVAEQRDIAGFMRFVGQNTSGAEPILLLHNQPALPYAVHMAGRAFPTVSLNSAATIRVVPASLEGARREAELARIERAGGWTQETVKRAVERDYDVILIQEQAMTLDPEVAALLDDAFEAAGATDFRGSRVVLYKRKT
jgi:hypothetical protein